MSRSPETVRSQRECSLVHYHLGSDAERQEAVLPPGPNLVTSFLRELTTVTVTTRERSHRPTDSPPRLAQVP